jgi:hypothetical protein
VTAQLKFVFHLLIQLSVLLPVRTVQEPFASLGMHWLQLMSLFALMPVRTVKEPFAYLEMHWLQYFGQ